MRILILALLAIGSLYNIFLQIIKLRSANNPTPENVADIYDAETYSRWKQYCVEHCRLQIVFGAITAVVSFAVLFSNAYAAFAALFPNTVFWQLFSVVIVEVAVGTVLAIPREYIANMVIEQKYGFNRSTMKTFAMDRIRGILLDLFLSTLFASLFAGVHQWLGNYMVIVCAAALVGFTLLITFLYPVFSRIGNKFTPLEDGELRDSLMKLLTSHGYTVRAIEVMDASRRTTKLNAYFTGFGKMKTIVLYDNLVNAMSPDEICAVFAHELGHGLHKDTTKLQLMNIGYFLLMATVVWLLIIVTPFYEAFGFVGVNYGFTYILMGIFMTLLQPFTGMISNAFSRKFEYRADQQAVLEGYGKAMIPALKKLAKDNFAHLSPSPIDVVLEYSHPPIDKRIAALESALAANEK